MVSSHTWHWRALIGLTVLTLAGGFLLPKLAVAAGTGRAARPGDPARADQGPW